MNASISLSLLSNIDGLVLPVPLRTISVKPDHLSHSPTACISIGVKEVGYFFDNTEASSAGHWYFPSFLDSKPMLVTASSNIVMPRSVTFNLTEISCLAQVYFPVSYAQPGSICDDIQLFTFCNIHSVPIPVRRIHHKFFTALDEYIACFITID